ncbi:MAG: hypothetical protein RLZZ407_1130, partial [Pseudomonadota bacterium]
MREIFRHFALVVCACGENPVQPIDRVLAEICPRSGQGIAYPGIAYVGHYAAPVAIPDLSHVLIRDGQGKLGAHDQIGRAAQVNLRVHMWPNLIGVGF